MSLTYREVTLDDADALNRLHDAVWFPGRSPEGWRWLLHENPHQVGRLAGLVAEHPDKGIIGFIGNHVVRLAGRGGEFEAATGYSMLADSNHPGAGVRLLGGLLRQKEGFGLFTLNNNKLAEQVYPRFRGEPLLAQTSSIRLQWITNPMLFVAGGMRRRAHALRGYSTARARERFHNPSSAPETARIDRPDIRLVSCRDVADGALAEFWNRLRDDGRIHACRDSESLNWRLSNPDQTQDPIILAFDRGDGVEGLLVAMLTKESEISPPALTVIDLTALASVEDTALPALIQAAMSIARKNRLAKLVLPYVSPYAFRALGPLAASRYQVREHVHAHIKFFKDAPRDEILKHWSPTPWDGDFSFCLRQPPARIVSDANA